MLEIDSIAKEYAGPAGPVPVLRAFSLRAGPGEMLAIQGPSGGGKTTLLLAAGGMLRPDQGTVRIQGRDLYAMAPGQRAGIRARLAGFVFQQFHLLPYLTVLDNVLAAGLAGGGAGLQSRALELIERFGLAHRRNHVPAQLSTGERQRTALARALLNQPPLILADEPTGNLDAENGAQVLEFLRRFAADGGTVLLATHEPEVARYASRIILLKSLTTHTAPSQL